MSHALLSPSAASRWLKCTPAPRLEALFPDKTSPYAEEGTLAHELCEVLLRQAYDGVDLSDRVAAIRANPLYSGEMQETAEDYAAFVMERLAAARHTTPDAQLFIEQRINLTAYVPDGFGTVDALIIADDLVEVIDFKYGKGVAVSAERNPQMMIYALGAVSLHDALFNIRRVRLTIIQPRIHNSNSWELVANELREWGRAVLLPLARQAFEGEGKQVTGDHCRFCRAKGVCRALADEADAMVDEADATAGGKLLTAAELAERLPHFDRVESYIEAAKEAALALALDGETLPGFKVVEGRSVRKITDENELANRALCAGFDEAMLYKPRSLETLTNLEKLIGKKQFAAIAEGLIDKPQGKPTLVPEDDKRPAMVIHLDDFISD